MRLPIFVILIFLTSHLSYRPIRLPERINSKTEVTYQPVNLAINEYGATCNYYYSNGSNSSKYIGKYIVKSNQDGINILQKCINY